MPKNWKTFEDRLWSIHTSQHTHAHIPTYLAKFLDAYLPTCLLTYLPTDIHLHQNCNMCIVQHVTTRTLTLPPNLFCVPYMHHVTWLAARQGSNTMLHSVDRHEVVWVLSYQIFRRNPSHIFEFPFSNFAARSAITISEFALQIQPMDQIFISFPMFPKDLFMIFRISHWILDSL